jgi:hypothetical protein
MCRWYIIYRRSKEAIDTLNVFLSEHKDNFCCIIAGYEKDIEKCFFMVNKGLERRFQWVHKITDYSDKELAMIMMKMIQEIKWSININLINLTEFIKKNKSCFKNFGGDIETFLSKCKMAHARRVFSLEEHHRCILTMEDLNTAKALYDKNILESENIKLPFGMYL